MNKTIIISNSCVGNMVHTKLKYGKYNSPLMSTLIPNDDEYLKLCQNLEKYMELDPICNFLPKENTIFSIQNKGIYYKNKLVPIPYPIIHLNDVEIHCIHETNCEDALEKFNRRRIRLLEQIKNGDYQIINLWSFSELFNNHSDVQELINTFLRTNIDNVVNVFLGPPKYNKKVGHYIDVNKWNKVKLQRDSSHVYSFNNQYTSCNYFVEYLEKII